MMTGSNFYTLQGQVAEANALQTDIIIDPDHDIFKGHFPGRPVVPGVCMVAIIKELIELHLDTSFQLIKANQIKFLQPIIPEQDQVIRVTINWQPPEATTYMITAQWQLKGIVAFKLNGTLRPV